MLHPELGWKSNMTVAVSGRHSTGQVKNFLSNNLKMFNLILTIFVGTEWLFFLPKKLEKKINLENIKRKHLYKSGTFKKLCSDENFAKLTLFPARK